MSPLDKLLRKPWEQTWRCGRRAFRTIYTDNATKPNGDGDLIGMLDTPALATFAASAPTLYRALKRILDDDHAPSHTCHQPAGEEGCNVCLANKALAMARGET